VTPTKPEVAQPFRAAIGVPSAAAGLGWRIAGLKPCATLVAVLLALVCLSAQQPPDRSKPPQLGPAPTLRLPEIQKHKLANGLPVWLVELHEVPVVQVNLLVFGGSANETGKRFGAARSAPR
jgi:hypothetical protein